MKVEETVDERRSGGHEQMEPLESSSSVIGATGQEVKSSRSRKQKMSQSMARKLSFSGRQQPLLRQEFANNFRWVRHVIGQGEDERTVWVKILNVERMKRVIQMRKLLTTNFLNSNGKRELDKNASRFGWFKEIQDLKSKSTIKDKYLSLNILRRARTRIRNNNKRKLSSEVKQRGSGELAAAATRPGLETTDAVAFPDPNDFTHPFNSEKRRHAPFETPLEAGHKKNHFRSLVEAKFGKLQSALAMAVPRRRSRSETKRIRTAGSRNVQQPSESELIKELKRVAVSDEAFEVLVNFKLAEMDPKKRGDFASLFQIYCITLRHAIYRHDWALVSKSCEGLCHEVQSGQQEDRSTRNGCIWNGALLGLVNIYKDDPSTLIKSARLMQYAMQVYPRRIGIDLATLLTQKGHFSEGVEELEAMHNSLPKIHSWKRLSVSNPKRHLIDFVAELFTAANQYAIYKCQKRLAELDGSGEGVDASQVFEMGRFVLTLFEILEKRGEEFECDSTILLEPLIDLTLTLNGRDAAKETFERIYKKNYQHGVLAELYLEFLQEYFPDEIQEIHRLKLLTQFAFFVSPAVAKIRQAKFNRLLKRLPAVPTFKRIPNPSFSW